MYIHLMTHLFTFWPTPAAYIEWTVTVLMLASIMPLLMACLLSVKEGFERIDYGVLETQGAIFWHITLITHLNQVPILSPSPWI